MNATEIRALRGELRLTQHGLAALLGVHPITVSKWERGRASPTGTTRRRLGLLRMPDEGGDFARLVAVLRSGAVEEATIAIAELVRRVLENRRGRVGELEARVEQLEARVATLEARR